MKKIVFSVALIFFATAGFSQSQGFEMHSLFMYSFTRFVQWPPEESQGDIEIAVLGESQILPELKKMAERKKPGGRTIHITKVSSIAEIKKSHILYISPEWSAKFAEVSAKVGEAPTLLVTEQAAEANKGCVNFTNNKDGRLAFELNQAQMTKHKLRASAELTRMAIVN